MYVLYTYFINMSFLLCSGKAFHIFASKSVKFCPDHSKCEIKQTLHHKEPWN